MFSVTYVTFNYSLFIYNSKEEKVIMKKILLPLIIASMTLVACQAHNNASKENSESSNGGAASADVYYTPGDFSIVSPTGAPALAFYNYANLSNFETNSTPTNIVAMMGAGQKDVVVLPTNAGMQTILKQSEQTYKIAATITFGNFYLVSMGNDADNVMNEGDTILLFQKNNVPDKIFHYIYGDSFNANIHYVSAVNDAVTACISGSFVDADTGTNMTPNYVLLAEPALSNVLSKKETITVYANIQEKYKEKSNNKEMFQASVFVKTSLEEGKVKLFLSSLREDIEGAIADPTKLSAGMNKASNAQELFGVAPAMAENVLKKNNGMGLGFKYAKENKAAIENFLTIFGLDGSNEALYF